MSFKIVVSDPKSKKSYQKEVSQKDSGLIGKRVGDKVKGDFIGLSGYELQITGGSDKQGFPMNRGVQGQVRKRVILTGSPGFRPTRDGERRRKSVRGNTVSSEISQVNTKVVSYGKKKIDDLFGAKEKKEEKPEEKKEEKPAEKKEKPAEEKKEPAKEESKEKPEKKEEKPVKEEQKKEEPAKEKPEKKEEKKAEKEPAKSEGNPPEGKEQKPEGDKKSEEEKKEPAKEESKKEEPPKEQKKPEEKPAESSEEKPEGEKK